MSNWDPQNIIEIMNTYSIKPIEWELKLLEKYCEQKKN